MGIAIVGGGLALIVIAGIAAFLLFDINSFKIKIERAVSEAIGMDVRINGKMGLSFYPLGLSAKDIHLSGEGAKFPGEGAKSLGEGTELLTLESLKIGMKMMPLLHRRLEITRCVLVKPAITIMRNPAGKYNFESHKKKAAPGPGSAFDLADLMISDGVLTYIDMGTGEKTEFRQIDLTVKNLLIPDVSGEIIKNISFTGDVHCKKALRKGLTIENLKGLVTADKGVYSFRSLSMDVLGGKGEGDVTANMSEADVRYEVNVKVSKLDFVKLEESFGVQKVIGGKGDLSVSLTAKEKGHRKLVNGLEGTFSLRGDNLATYTMDLDKVLTSYVSSQQLHLVDLGAYFIVGPLSTIALKGYRYGDLYYQTQGGKGTITTFVSHWTIKNGEAVAKDCAFATHHHRVALKGKLNFVGERFDHIVVAILDDQGCVQFRQDINGSFDSPQIGKMSTVESLAGPLVGLYRKAKRFIQGGKCEVFYSGSVKQPR
jgi:AsmA protein